MGRRIAVRSSDVSIFAFVGVFVGAEHVVSDMGKDLVWCSRSGGGCVDLSYFEAHEIKEITGFSFLGILDFESPSGERVHERKRRCTCGSDDSVLRFVDLETSLRESRSVVRSGCSFSYLSDCVRVRDLSVLGISKGKSSSLDCCTSSRTLQRHEKETMELCSCKHV